MLHYTFGQLDTKLIQLTASSTRSKWLSEKNIRLIILLLILMLIPIFILSLISCNYSYATTWILALTAFNIELIIKIIVSLIVYSLLMIQSTSTETNGIAEKLDDFIFVIKTFGHSVEFLVAIFLFFNGLYIVVFESYGSIRCIMMVIHAYFHIYLQAIKGLDIFNKRRTAELKISKLKILNSKSNSNETIKEDYFNTETCPICFCNFDMQEVRITSCFHLFHTKCIKKWIYVSSTCPMCQKEIISN